MTTDELRLLRTARVVLERYMFDGETLRDDVAELCMRLDDFLPPQYVPREQASTAVDQAA
jgi:hypothetical protein